MSESMPFALPEVVATHIDAVNAGDTDAVVATYAPDAMINDAHREIVGTEAIRAFVDKEIVGDRVAMKVREVAEHYGDLIVRAEYDGAYDKTNLPDELILTNYFTVRDGLIVTHIVVHNQPSPY